MHFAVCGLHLRGFPLNAQLLALHATFVRAARTDARYTMHALRSSSSSDGSNGGGGVVEKPGLVFHPGGAATAGAIAVEVWEVPDAAVGELLQLVPAPLGFGTVVLEAGEQVKGFIAEGWAGVPDEARRMGVKSVDITATGGWANYVKGKGPAGD